MSDEQQTHEEHGHSKNPFANMSNKQKLLAGGLVLVVGLGVWAARNRSNASSSTTPDYSYNEDAPLYIDKPNVPSGDDSTGDNAPSDDDLPPIPANPNPFPSGSSGGGYNTGINPNGGYNSTVGAIFGNGGINYNTASQADKTAIEQNQEKLKNDKDFLASEMVRTDNVIINRNTAGLDTSAQVKYRDQLAEQAVLTPVSTVTNPGLGNGGVDYSKVNTQQAKTILETQQQLIKTNPDYVAQELARTQAVIDNRTAAGLDISAQLKYQNQLQAQQASGSVAPSSGSTVKVEQPKTVNVPTSTKPSTVTSGISAADLAEIKRKAEAGIPLTNPTKESQAIYDAAKPATKTTASSTVTKTATTSSSVNSSAASAAAASKPSTTTTTPKPVSTGPKTTTSSGSTTTAPKPASTSSSSVSAAQQAEIARKAAAGIPLTNPTKETQAIYDAMKKKS
jgi:hypothetical protein